MVKSERVKVAVLVTGETVIADVQEAVHRETGERQAWVFNFPYKVTYDEPKLDGTGIVLDPEVKVHYQPWCPLSVDVQMAVNTAFVASILEPVPSLRDTYIENVRKMGGEVE